MGNNTLYQEIGYKIRSFRKTRNMTLSELADRIGKSIATVSKYESGEVAISIDALIDICKCFNIDPGVMLPMTSTSSDEVNTERYGKFYEELLYIYWYNGGQNRVRTALIDNRGSSRSHTALYMDINSPDEIEKATFIYTGKMDYSDTGTVFLYTNTMPPFDKMTVRVPSFTRRQPHRIGLMLALTYYYQNVAVKVIAASVPIKDPSSLLHELKLTNEEIKDIRRSNFLIV